MAPPRLSALSLDRSERQVTVYRDDRYFTKNPDVVLLPGGKLLCVFNETDYHWPREFSRITLLESRDYGATWGNPRIVDQAYRSRGEERWVTPRISRLRDGRLVIVCDQDDYQHCHESQQPGIYAWWSEDDGDTWGPRVATGIPGIEPDRVRELEDGTLLVGSRPRPPLRVAGREQRVSQPVRNRSLAGAGLQLQPQSRSRILELGSAAGWTAVRRRLHQRGLAPGQGMPQGLLPEAGGAAARTLIGLAAGAGAHRRFGASSPIDSSTASGRWSGVLPEPSGSGVSNW